MNMLGRSKVSLNELSFDAAFGLVERALEKGIRITKVPASNPTLSPFKYE